ncbi:hypothetical protein PGT21_002049 [Puccinia graminis f. sp. tritici]|uniref:Uncharacterized protein n=1 Tax=Puccinia graminis f. sp. tritici TaxID=56615 RepID=A0A5B0QEX3_PUCGR|nr:hypothetical protein PGT21_002049 [Puccinia graminis f. sp. tritici]
MRQLEIQLLRFKVENLHHIRNHHRRTLSTFFAPSIHCRSIPNCTILVSPHHSPGPKKFRRSTVITQVETPSGSGGSLRNGVPAPAERFRDLSGGSARLGYSIHRRTIDAAVLRDTATFAYRVYSLGTAHDKNYGNWLGTETVLSEQMLVVSD